MIISNYIKKLILSINHKILYKFSLILFAINLSSCFQVTYRLWHFHNYVEDFQYFFVSNDRKFVVFATDKFHYVFDNYSGTLENILTLEYKKFLFIDVDESYIEIDKNNFIKGDIVFDVFNEKLNPNLEYFLKELGFYKAPEGMTKRFELRGKRYISHDNFIESLPSFDQKYPIEIRLKLNFGEDLIASILTPLTITTDGIVMIGETILNPFYD